MIRFYIDEPNVGSDSHLPMSGPDKDTQFYNSREEAEIEAERLSELAEICFIVFEHDTDKQSRVISDNPSPAARDKFAWLDEIHTLNHLADELRRE